MKKYIVNGSHIFIFGICGKSASTALQRILNSSEEICIWGEQHYLIDGLLKIINQIDVLSKDEFVNRDTKMFFKSFADNEHFFHYANAIGNMAWFKSSLIASLCNHLAPVDSKIDRFGFKDIRIESITTLDVLSKIFQNCHFIFLMRNPIEQWKSVSNHKWWHYSSNLQDFLSEYCRISEIMLEYIKFNGRCTVMENCDIQNPAQLNKVLNKVNISRVDSGAVTRKTTFGKIKFSLHDYAEIIKSHSAYVNYMTLKNYKL